MLSIEDGLEYGENDADAEARERRVDENQCRDNDCAPAKG
jgi:hypothetical protein